MGLLHRLAGTGLVSLITAYVVGRVGRRLPLEPDAEARGRYASTPGEMTRLGWKDILTRTVKEALDDRLLSEAAGVAFFALMALVPALSVLVSVFGLVANPADITTRIGPFLDMLPNGARELVVEQAVRLAAQSSSTLSIKLLASLAIAIWSANAAIKAIFDALNIIYEEEEKRSFLKLNAISLFVTFSAAVVMVVILFLIAVAPALIALMPFSAALDATLHALRWPAFLLIAILAIAVLYWIGPSRHPARFVWVLPGALLAALLWAGVSAGFSWYVARFGTYEATYGSLSAVIIFMTWLWTSASVILLGAEFNSELEHQTARDTTLGQPKPIGLRGAAMADRIGEAVARD